MNRLKEHRYQLKIIDLVSYGTEKIENALIHADVIFIGGGNDFI